MKRTLSLIFATAFAVASLTASADTHLWITTEGSGLEITSGPNGLFTPGPPPPPRPMGQWNGQYHGGPHHDAHHCKQCKKHYKKVKKQSHKHHKAEQGTSRPHGKH